MLIEEKIWLNFAWLYIMHKKSFNVIFFTEGENEKLL